MPSKELPHWFKLVTVWLVVILVLFLGFQAWEQHRVARRFQLDGRTVVLERAPDGHFHWPARVNGVEVDFLMDTGATRSALPAALAARMGLALRGEVQTQTAGGAARGHIALADLELAGGMKVQRLPVMVLPELGAPLLGMDVLGRLHFSQRDGELRIEGER